MHNTFDSSKFAVYQPQMDRKSHQQVEINNNESNEFYLDCIKSNDNFSWTTDISNVAENGAEITKVTCSIVERICISENNFFDIGGYVHGDESRLEHNILLGHNYRMKGRIKSFSAAFVLGNCPTFMLATTIAPSKSTNVNVGLSWDNNSLLPYQLQTTATHNFRNGVSASLVMRHPILSAPSIGMEIRRNCIKKKTKNPDKNSTIIGCIQLAKPGTFQNCTSIKWQNWPVSPMYIEAKVSESLNYPNACISLVLGTRLKFGQNHHIDTGIAIGSRGITLDFSYFSCGGCRISFPFVIIHPKNIVTHELSPITCLGFLIGTALFTCGMQYLAKKLQLKNNHEKKKKREKYLKEKKKKALIYMDEMKNGSYISLQHEKKKKMA